MTMSMMRELLVGADAAGRLVEQQHLRLHHHRHRDVEELAHAFGQDAGRLVAILA